MHKYKIGDLVKIKSKYWNKFVTALGQLEHLNKTGPYKIIDCFSKNNYMLQTINVLNSRNDSNTYWIESEIYLISTKCKLCQN